LADPVTKRDAEPRKESTTFLALRLTLAAVPLAVAAGTVMGLGLLRAVPAGLALGAGLALAILPATGLSRLTPSRARLSAGWTWAWCLALLAGLPLYFPGEREAAVSTGLEGVTAFLGEGPSRQIGELGARFASLLGEDPAPLPARVGAPRAGPLAPPDHRPKPQSVTSIEAERASADPSRVELKYRGDEHSLRIQVEVDGPEVGEAFTLVFDTGATFTTLDRHSLRSIGIEVEPGSPRVTLQTANGAIEADLVLVDAIWLGDSPVEWVTVAICDSCVHEPAVGLLGLNVSQRFHVSLDHERKTIDLQRRTRGDDRSPDIRNWLKVRSETRENWDGTLETELTAFNDSRRKVRSAVIDLECAEAVLALHLEEIPARGQATARADLPRGTDCREAHLELSRADWHLDRFGP